MRANLSLMERVAQGENVNELLPSKPVAIIAAIVGVVAVPIFATFEQACYVVDIAINAAGIPIGFMFGGRENLTIPAARIVAIAVIVLKIIDRLYLYIPAYSLMMLPVYLHCTEVNPAYPFARRMISAAV